jgi:putative transcriptional regulator
MLNENLKRLRNNKGLSQEELAIRLNVVRQTISKWEKGLSVPDADLLIKIADVFEVSVSELLGANYDSGDEVQINAVAEQLMRINEQLAIKNSRSRRIWKTVGIVFLIFLVINILLILIAVLGSVIFSFGEPKVNVIEHNELILSPYPKTLL